MLSPLFLASLTAGLLLGVYWISTGVERERPGGGARLALALPGAAAFLTLCGLVGYLLLRWTSLAPVAATALAVLAGIAAASGAVALVTRWAVPSAAADPADPRYLLQGTPARVTRAMSPEQDGEVTYEVDGARYATQARSFDGSRLDVGDEVVIDRVEDGVAHVEAWALVEQRL